MWTLGIFEQIVISYYTVAFGNMSLIAELQGADSRVLAMLLRLFSNQHPGEIPPPPVSDRAEAIRRISGNIELAREVTSLDNAQALVSALLRVSTSAVASYDSCGRFEVTRNESADGIASLVPTLRDLVGRAPEGSAGQENIVDALSASTRTYGCPATTRAMAGLVTQVRAGPVDAEAIVDLFQDSPEDT
jgi:hypothetical protein